MDNVSKAQKDIFAIKIVLQNMIALMDKDAQEVLKKLTSEMTDTMVSSGGDLAHHFEYIRESAMEMINIATKEPE
ncbi:hypothetical protein LJPFL01_2209 [Lelliottia jeotgali]|nr:hypothetical protein LJPFL01_2209 [Lelliottia jeotgali]